MVWDGENGVGLNKSLFPVYYHLLCHFVVIFSLGTLGVSLLGPILGMLHRTAGVQHLVSELVHMTLGRDPSGSVKRQAVRFTACTQSARAAGHTFEDLQ